MLIMLLCKEVKLTILVIIHMNKVDIFGENLGFQNLEKLVINIFLLIDLISQIKYLQGNFILLFNGINKR